MSVELPVAPVTASHVGDIVGKARSLISQGDSQPQLGWSEAELRELDEMSSGRVKKNKMDDALSRCGDACLLFISAAVV